MKTVSRVSSLSTTAIVFASLSGVSASFAQEFNYAEAAEPYAGVTIRVLDEVTPLQETLVTLVPKFTEETGINVEYELLNHLDVINKGQADMLSRSGTYDAVMLHDFQLGPLLDAQTIKPIGDFLENDKLANPNLDQDDFIQRPFQQLSFFGGEQYGFPNWNYNMVYWARADLLNDEGEKAAFKKEFGYDLGPAETLGQFRDIASFFTRDSGEMLKGEPLTSDLVTSMDVV